MYIEEVSGDPDHIKHASETGRGLSCAWKSSKSVKRGRIVYVGGGLFLDFLNCGSLALRDDTEQLAVNLDRIGVQPTELIEHDEQADAGGIHGIEFPSDEKFTGTLAVHTAPSCLVLLLGYRERMVWVDDGDVGTGHTGNFIKLLANLCLEPGSCCGLVEDFLARYFNSSTVVLLRGSTREARGTCVHKTYLKGAVTKEDGLCSHHGLERAEEREEP